MSIPEPAQQHLAAGLVPDPLLGTKYRALERIGQGGMGDVVLAEHLELGREVVVKLLDVACQSDSEMVDRMRIEAQTLARLSHPNIVVVNDVGRTPAGRPFVVMERLRGRTLHARLHDPQNRDSSVPLGEALAIIQSVLDALGAAHELGVVHRDVKPANIFLHEPRAAGGAEGQREPIVKLLDFGLAKVLAGASPHAPRPLAQPTEDGAVLGTPGYLSPEQAAGRPLDVRSDVYAAGLVLYRMIAGRRPFEGSADEVASTLKKVPAPPSRHSREPIPPELDLAVLKALAKDPDVRFQTAREFATALGLILESWSQPVGWSPTLGFDGSGFAGPMPDYIRERFPFAAASPAPQAAGASADGKATPAPGTSVPVPNSRPDRGATQAPPREAAPDGARPGAATARAPQPAAHPDRKPPPEARETSLSSGKRATPVVVFALAVILTASLAAALVAWLVSGS